MWLLYLRFYWITVVALITFLSRWVIVILNILCYDFVELKKDLVYNNTVRLKSPIILKWPIILTSTQPISNISSNLHSCLLNYLCWFSWRPQHLPLTSDLSNVALYSLQNITTEKSIFIYSFTQRMHLSSWYLPKKCFVTFMSISNLSSFLFVWIHTLYRIFSYFLARQSTFPAYYLFKLSEISFYIILKAKIFFWFIYC